MHEVIIYPFKVQSKTKAMNAELKRYGENVNKEYRVMEEIMETSPDLAGRAWDSARSYIRDIQQPLLKTTMYWIEAQTEANNRYYHAAAALPQVQCLDQRQLETHLDNWERKLNREYNRENPSSARIWRYSRLIREISSKLNAMERFVSQTTGLYDHAMSIQDILDRADTEINKVSFNTETKQLHFTEVNTQWILDFERLRDQEKLKADGLTEEQLKEAETLGFTIGEVVTAWEEMKAENIGRAEIQALGKTGLGFGTIIKAWNGAKTEDEKRLVSGLLNGNYGAALRVNPEHIGVGSRLFCMEYFAKTATNIPVAGWGSITEVFDKVTTGMSEEQKALIPALVLGGFLELTGQDLPGLGKANGEGAVSHDREIEELRDRLFLIGYMAVNKEALMDVYMMETDEEYGDFMNNAYIMLELWHSKYQHEVAKMMSMTEEERLWAYPLGIGKPQNDLIFLGQMQGFTLEERVALLEALKKEEHFDNQVMCDILGREPSGREIGAVIVAMTYRTSRAGLTMAEYYSQGFQMYTAEAAIGMNMALMPRAMEIAYNSVNPRESVRNLNPDVRLDAKELESRFGYTKPVVPKPVVVPNGQPLSEEGPGERTIPNRPKTGADRAAKYSSSWETGSLKDTVSTYADGVDPITTDTGKIIYRNTKTGIDVVYDIEGDYFRIIDNNITGKRSALDLNGNAIPNNVITEKGTQRGMTQGEYNASSHFNNSDLDFPYDK